MPAKTYLDFDVRFERAGSGYVARVEGAPAGTAVSDFTMPATDGEPRDLSAVTRAAREIMGPGPPTPGAEREKARAFGAHLYEGIFHGALDDCLRRSLNSARLQEHGLRIRLHLGATPELTAIPW